MTLPTTQQNAAEDDSDMFGPPHTSPPVRRNRPKIPMISAQMRLREVRKRILQLCVHKLERIKDSERNLRRSVCINNTYSRLTDDIRREKQNKHQMLNNCSKSDKKSSSTTNSQPLNNNNENLNNNSQQMETNCSRTGSNNNEISTTSCRSPKRHSSTDADLETLDRELCALDAHMPLVDPEITQGAEQLEQAMVSRKRKSSLSEEENDRLVREALSQFYMPSTRLLSAIDDCPLMGVECKRQKTDMDMDLSMDMNQNQKEFECIIDALRMGSNGGSVGNCTNNQLNLGGSGGTIDSCGQAAMMGESGNVFHNLVVASLET